MRATWGALADQDWQDWQLHFPKLELDLAGDQYHTRLIAWWSRQPADPPKTLNDRGILRDNILELRMALRDALSDKPAVSQEELLTLAGGSIFAAAAPFVVKAWKLAALIEPVTAGSVAALCVPVGYGIVKVRREAVFLRRERVFRPTLQRMDGFRANLLVS